MVAKSDLIVVATVARLEQITLNSDSLDGPRFQADLRVEKILKGNTETSLTLPYFPKSPAGYRLTEKQQYIFFLMRQGHEHRAVQGYRGVARINKDQVEDVAMLKEQPNQPLEDFLARVASYVRGENGLKVPGSN